MKNLDRTEKLKKFISENIHANKFEIKPLTADASSRKYFRAILDNGTNFVIMDDEGCRCKTSEFVELSSFLRARGAYVPEVIAKDMTEGFLLLEDLGDDSVSKRLTPKNEKKLYLMSAEALAKVIKITQRPTCTTNFDKEKLLSDILLFTDWYYPMTIGQPLATQAKNEFFKIFAQLSEMAFKVPNRMVLWDYHIDNIMLPPNSKECAIIDFQDAMWGPLTYDIVSLLAADRRTASKATIEKVKNAFFNQLNNISRADFDDSFAFLSAFRHMRVLGRFTTLSMVNQKEKYLNYIPQTWAMLEQAINYPALALLKTWLDKNIPVNKRGLPQRKAINQAMILAAGRGSRMQNLTDECPKPLIKVGQKALIDYSFDRLKEVKINNVVVNLCYKGDMIKQHLLQNHSDFKIDFSEETEALETGGGIKKALPLLKENAFFVCNSDVFFIDEGYKPALWRMMDAWDENQYDILLLLQPTDKVCGDCGGNYKINDCCFPERNTLKQEGFPYMFGGISIVSRKIFADAPNGKFSLRDLFDVAEKRGKLGFVINEASFFHVGTPHALEAANAKINGHK